MPDIVIPDVSQDAIDRIDEAAANLGLSRDEYLRLTFEKNLIPAAERLAAMDQWMNVLDELLARPLPARADWTDRDLPHHVDLRVSQEFWDEETGDEDYSVDFDFAADRARLAAAITKRYGPPRRIDLMPYAPDRPDLSRPGWTLLSYMREWFTEIDLWLAGERGIVVEIGQVDKELPLQLMLVVGEYSDPRTGPVIELREASFTTVVGREIRPEPSTEHPS